MANAAVFMLIANDGRADQMIMATSLLHARIDDVRGIRMDMGHDDINPTLADIERTHLLFMNATFKPFAAFGFEYQRVQPTGSIAYGSTLKYSIPQAGDFFADMGVLFTMNALAAATGTAHPATAGEVLVGGSQLADAEAVKLPVRYADFPGERIVAQGKFTVNSNTLHEYDHHASAFWRKFKLPATKYKAYCRMVGQEIGVPAEFAPQNDAGLAATNDPPAVGWYLTETSAQTTAVTHRFRGEVVNGLQTPKSSHAAATFWHKCQFWFNKDPRLMVPSVSIPYGQRFVELTLCTANQLIRAVGGTDTSIDAAQATTRDTEHYSSILTATIGTANGWADHHGLTMVASNMGATSTLDSTSNGAPSTADLYVNNVYVLPDIHDIYIHRIGFNLIRVTRSHSVSVTASSTPEQQLHQLKWPIEAVYFGVQADAVKDDLDFWWRMGNPDHQLGAIVTLTSDGTAAVEAANLVQGVSVPYHYVSQGTRTMTAVTISLHGTKVYDAMDPTFFSDYMPATFGGSNVSCSDDQNSHALFFGFYPGTYQPSGHVNISRARELYFKWSQSAVAGTFYAVADAINFLLISDGNAILRYTT